MLQIIKTHDASLQNPCCKVKTHVVRLGTSLFTPHLFHVVKNHVVRLRASYLFI